MNKRVFALTLGGVGLMFQAAIAHAQLDHMMCYKVTDGFKFATPPSVDMLADLQPEFTQMGCTLIKPVEFCVPANKTNVQPPAANVNSGIVGQPLQNDYICYSARCPKQVGPPSKIVTDQFGTHPQKNYKPLTVCVPAGKQPVECNVGAPNQTAAMCNGACPGEGRCAFDRKNKTCICVNQTQCTGKPSTAGSCGGPCPSGQQCRTQIKPGTTTLECACQNDLPGCSFDAFGNCGGTCPTDPSAGCAKDSSGNCSCVPPASCQGPPGPAGCPGTCPLTGQQCHPDATTGLCTCGPSGCGLDPATGSCTPDGCPSGQQCRLDTAASPPTCACVPQTNVACVATNQAGAAPQCGGTCPAGSPQGSVCGFDNGGACTCLVPTPPPVPGCSQTGTTCGGTCPAGSPPGSTCGTDPTTGQCTCLSPVPGCGPGAVTNTCNNGACPAPETCQLIPSAAGPPFCGCK